MTTTPWLSDSEVDDLCAGLKQSAAQARYLRCLGLKVRFKPNGRPLVMRADVEDLSGEKKKAPSGNVPNRLALVAALEKEGIT